MATSFFYAPKFLFLVAISLALSHIASGFLVWRRPFQKVNTTTYKVEITNRVRRPIKIHFLIKDRMTQNIVADLGSQEIEPQHAYTWTIGNRISMTNSIIFATLKVEKIVNKIGVVGHWGGLGWWAVMVGAGWEKVRWGLR
ncbi:hypothetical protein LIER_29825 [Lithospermum erythrorhizon]|uniref:Uncharacterized protein n=1 Tax=Lithospermum erythrorhizon TaxID=34254 RepID=A0AAV3RNR4_LITER